MLHHHDARTPHAEPLNDSSHLHVMRPRRDARRGEHDVSPKVYMFLCGAIAETEPPPPPAESKQDPSVIRGAWGDVRKTSCSPAHIPIPDPAGSGTCLAGRQSWKTHAYPGSSAFHPCHSNIDIGRQNADTGYVMMQLKPEPFCHYLQGFAPPPFPHFERQI